MGAWVNQAESVKQIIETHKIENVDLNRVYARSLLHQATLRDLNTGMLPYLSLLLWHVRVCVCARA